MTKLYHAEIGIPSKIKTIFGKIHLQYTNHAMRASQNDQYGHIDLPAVLDTTAAKVIEVEVGMGNVTEKVVYRVTHDSQYDLVIVVIPNCGIVKTVWLNAKDDNHNTLNKNKYEKVTA